MAQVNVTIKVKINNCLFIIVITIYHVFPFVSVRTMMGELFPTLESDLDAFLTYAEKQDGM